VALIRRTGSLVSVLTTNNSEAHTTKCKGPGQQLVDPSGIKYTFSSVSCTSVRNPANLPKSPSARLKFLSLRITLSTSTIICSPKAAIGPLKNSFPKIRYDVRCRRGSISTGSGNWAGCIAIAFRKTLSRIILVKLTSRLAFLKLIHNLSPAWTLRGAISWPWGICASAVTSRHALLIRGLKPCRSLAII